MSVCVCGGAGGNHSVWGYGWKSLGCPTLQLDGVDVCASKLRKWEVVVYLLGN